MLSLTRVGLTTAHRAAPNAAAATMAKMLRPALVRTLIKIPQPPGGIVGTVNDAYIAPKPSKAHGSYHWTSERLVSIGLVPLVLAPFLTGTSTLLDSVLGASLLYHCHAGFQACIIDYIQKRTYGSIHNYAMWLLTLGTGVAGYGLYEIETKEGGLVSVISKVWQA